MGFLQVSCRILVVDDEPSIRHLLALTLQRAGYEVETAADARQAMHLCEAQPFQLVLSDVKMPETDGHALARWVASRYPETRTMLMTGYDSGCEQCPYAPRCRFLQKPFRPAEALQALREVLGGEAPDQRAFTEL